MKAVMKREFVQVTVQKVAAGISPDLCEDPNPRRRTHLLTYSDGIEDYSTEDHQCYRKRKSKGVGVVLYCA
jgi:hypothetical protein